MRRIQYLLNITSFSILTAGAFLLAGSAPVVAQRTVVQDAGAGRKVELHYNAADQVVEQRTLGPNGELLQKEILEYSPAAYIPQTTTTFYWPNGKVHKVTSDTYDNNANFTGEFIQVFDEAGKQISGHRLIHDPPTGVYQCNEWDVAAQTYKPRECPAGEESAGTPETVKTFTREAVVQQLQRARQLKGKEVAPPSPPAQVPVITTTKEVGFVMPAQVHPGERVSGSVVEDPIRYEGIPDVTVTRVTLPFQPSGAPWSLSGWNLEISGEPPQRADGPIALNIPPGTLEIAVMFRQAGNVGAPVSKAIPIIASARAKAKSVTGYKAPAICLKGQLCIVHGAFSGDSNKTFAAFEERPAQIVAETSEAAFIAIPERTEAGSRPLAIAEGSKAIAFPVVVAAFAFRPDRRDLGKGDLLLMYANLAGPEEMPDAEWRPGNYPASNLTQAQKLIAGFKLPGKDHEAHEKREAEEKREAKEKAAGGKEEHDEAEGGEILLVISNPTPDVAAFRDSKSGTYVFHLNADSFKMGDFMYKFVVAGVKAGNFDVRARVLTFLASIPGQEFAVGEPPAK